MAGTAIFVIVVCFFHKLQGEGLEDPTSIPSTHKHLRLSSDLLEHPHAWVYAETEVHSHPQKQIYMGT